MWVALALLAAAARAPAVGAGRTEVHGLSDGVYQVGAAQSLFCFDPSPGADIARLWRRREVVVAAEEGAAVALIADAPVCDVALRLAASVPRIQALFPPEGYVLSALCGSCFFEGELEGYRRNTAGGHLCLENQTASPTATFFVSPFASPCVEIFAHRAGGRATLSVSSALSLAMPLRSLVGATSPLWISVVLDSPVFHALVGAVLGVVAALLACFYVFYKFSQRMVPESLRGGVTVVALLAPAVAASSMWHYNHKLLELAWLWLTSTSYGQLALAGTASVGALATTYLGWFGRTCSECGEADASIDCDEPWDAGGSESGDDDEPAAAEGSGCCCRSRGPRRRVYLCADCAAANALARVKQGRDAGGAGSAPPRHMSAPGRWLLRYALRLVGGYGALSGCTSHAGVNLTALCLYYFRGRLAWRAQQAWMGFRSSTPGAHAALLAPAEAAALSALTTQVELEKLRRSLLASPELLDRVSDTNERRVLRWMHGRGEHVEAPAHHTRAQGGRWCAVM